MRTPVAPTYSNIFMGWLEQQILDTFAHKPLIYLRYLDIFMIWTHGKELLDKFIVHANQFHPTIKFTANISETSLSFLNSLVTLDKNNLTTTLKKNQPIKINIYTTNVITHVTAKMPYLTVKLCG